LAQSKEAGAESPLQPMADAEKELVSLRAAVDEVYATLRAKTEGIESDATGPWAEARELLFKLQGRARSMGARCQTLLCDLKFTRIQLTNDAYKAVLEVLRIHTKKEGISAQALFEQLGGSKTASVPVSSFRGFLDTVVKKKEFPEAELKASQLDLGLERFVGAGVSRFIFLQTLQEYFTCVKDIAITSAVGVKDSKTLRKILVGEVVQILEVPSPEETTGLHRAKSRALQDGKEGWVTLKGNQGTSFLEKSAKPHYCCEVAQELHSAFESNSAQVRQLRAGEVIELLEGPRQEAPLEVLRVKGRAAKDGKTGWVSLKDGRGQVLESVKVLVCRQTIAITHEFDIGKGKPIRKLEVGEVLELVEEAVEDSKKKLARVKARTKRDDKVGWVTMKGNQGTSYVEESDRHYICRRTTPIEAAFASGSGPKRSLEEGELFEVSEGPKPETKEGAHRIKGRCFSDLTEGWLTLDGSVKPWLPRYTCTARTAELTTGADASDAAPLRELEVGEELEALDTPVADGTGLVRIRVRATRDGLVGFATALARDGVKFLKYDDGAGARGGAAEEFPMVDGAAEDEDDEEEDVEVDPSEL